MTYSAPIHKVEPLRGRPEHVPVHLAGTSETVKKLEEGCPVVVQGLYVVDKVADSAQDKVYIVSGAQLDETDVTIYDCRDCAYYTLQYKRGVSFSAGDPLKMVVDANGKPIFDKAGTGDLVVAVVVEAPSDTSENSTEVMGVELLTVPYTVAA